jgi:putative transposase
VRYAVIDRYREQYPVRVMCDALEVSPSGYYAWRGRPESQRRRDDRRLKVMVRSVFRQSRETYGSPRIHHEFRAQGIRCSRKRIARLMKEEKLRPKKVRRFRRTTIVADDHPKAGNVLDRAFSVESPNTVWAGDITYLETRDGWLYLAVLLDLYSRRVVGWAVSSTLDQELVMRALNRALVERSPDSGLLHHSDRGAQYTSGSYQEELRRRGFTVSMSRKGNCWDNAVVESFFATLKIELGSTFSSRRAARVALFDYIEIFYNRQRRHTSLGGITPDEAEKRFFVEDAA